MPRLSTIFPAAIPNSWFDCLLFKPFFAIIQLSYVFIARSRCVMKIVKYPHPALRVPARPITAIDKEIHLAASRMLELMYTHEGLGLAAPQVALDIQMLVMNFAGDPNEKEQEFVAINPVIVELKGAVSDREGCLSFPSLYQNVRRAKTAKVQAYNLKGELYEMVCHDLPARVWQHEIDHLAGV